MKILDTINVIGSTLIKLNKIRKKDIEKMRREDKKTLEFCNTILMDFGNNEMRGYKEIYNLFYEKYIKNINKLPIFIQEDFIDLKRYCDKYSLELTMSGSKYCIEIQLESKYLDPAIAREYLYDQYIYLYKIYNKKLNDIEKKVFLEKEKIKKRSKL